MPGFVQRLKVTWFNTVPSLYPRKVAKHSRKNGHVNRISDKTCVGTRSFFSAFHSQQQNPKVNPSYIIWKLFTKMFALFEAIATSSLSFFPPPPLLIHENDDSLQRPAESGATPASEAAHLPCSMGKRPSSESSSLSKTRGKYLSGNPTRLSVLVWTELGWTSHFFPFCQNQGYIKWHIFTKKCHPIGIFQATGSALPLLEPRYKGKYNHNHNYNHKGITITNSWSCVLNLAAVY